MVLSGDVKSEKWFKKMMQIVIIQIMTDHDGYRRWYLTLGIQGGGGGSGIMVCHPRPSR